MIERRWPECVASKESSLESYKQLKLHYKDPEPPTPSPFPHPPGLSCRRTLPTGLGEGRCVGTGKSPGEVLRRSLRAREQVDLTPAFDSSRENPRGVDTLLGEQTTNKQDHLFLALERPYLPMSPSELPCAKGQPPSVDGNMPCVSKRSLSDLVTKTSHLQWVLSTGRRNSWNGPCLA